MRKSEPIVPVRAVPDEERRARIATRHGLRPSHRLPDACKVAGAMTALHATDPSTVHLSVVARSVATLAEIDRALYDDRSLVKLLAMRRTVFTFPRELLPAALGSAAARIAGPIRRQLARDVFTSGVLRDSAAWIATAMDAVVDLLSDGVPRGSRDIREALPQLAGRVERSPGKKYASTVSLVPSLLALMGAEGRVVRGPNDGDWRVPRPQWTLPEAWLGDRLRRVDAAEGYAELVSRWLWTFGPGTLDDLVWWLGATTKAVRQALADVGAVPVALASGAIGWLRPDDVAPVEPAGPWAALLPTLDPTTMGWRDRDFYLDPTEARYLFDSAGNGTSTIWLNGRIVGTWVQDQDGAVVLVLRYRLDPGSLALIRAEADRLTSWLAGDVVHNVYESKLRARKRLP